MKLHHFSPGLCFLTCVLLSSLVVLSSCARRLEPIPAPSPLPNVRLEYNTALFWTANYPESKKNILKAEEIEAFNEKMLASNEGVKDIFALPGVLNGSYLKEVFSKTRAYLESKGYYNSQNRKLEKSFYDKIFQNAGKIEHAISVRYGIITRETNARIIPTNSLAKNRGTLGNFDHFQAAQMDAGTPVAILHQSKDLMWYYVESDSISGWVPAADVATGEKPKVQYFAQARPLVITGKSASFYFDPELRDFAMKLDMGSTLPFLLKGQSVYEVVLPCRAPGGSLFFRSGYTGITSDVNQGYLPYTLENIFNQAFKMLNVPYVWGSKLDGTEDCSGFISNVFSCFGFRIARNSSNQEMSNLAKRIPVANMSDGDKVQLLKKIEGRPVLLYKPGHIMLYLGFIGERAYAIHSMWSYDEVENGRERERLVKKITVTDLNTGQGTKGGSYVHKLTSVVPLD